MVRRSSGLRERPSRARLPWWGRAVLAATAGLVASCSVSVVLTLAQHFEIRPFPRLEQIGGDLGANWMWANRLGVRTPLQPGFTFVDVDQTACRRFQPKLACKTGRPVGAALTAAFIDGARRSGASVIVVAAAPFESEAERQILAAALEPDRGPWVIAPIGGRPLGPGVMFGDPDQDLAPAGAWNRLRLASFEASTDPAAADALVRRYSVTTRYFHAGGRRIVPSAPYLAAILAEPARAPAADCEYFGRGCVGGRANNGVVPAAGEPVTSPIVYSLPSLSALDAQDSDLPDSIRDLAGKERLYYPSLGYDRLAASALLSPSEPVFALDRRFPGQIVVLGSSLPVAMDLHETPLGIMTGAEIFINAAHGFILQAKAGKMPGATAARDLSGELELKIGAALQGFLIMLPTWLVIFWLVARKPFRSAWTAFRARAIAVLIFFLGMATALYVELSEAAARLPESVRLGRHVDLLTPVLLLGLDGYVEAMKAVLARIEQGLLLLAGGAVALARRFLTRDPTEGA